MICVSLLDGKIYHKKNYDLWDINHNYTILNQIFLDLNKKYFPINYTLVFKNKILHSRDKIISLLDDNYDVKPILNLTMIIFSKIIKIEKHYHYKKLKEINNFIFITSHKKQSLNLYYYKCFNNIFSQVIFTHEIVKINSLKIIDIISNKLGIMYILDNNEAIFCSHKYLTIYDTSLLLTDKYIVKLSNVSKIVATHNIFGILDLSGKIATFNFSLHNTIEYKVHLNNCIDIYSNYTHLVFIKYHNIIVMYPPYTDNDLNIKIDKIEKYVNIYANKEAFAALLENGNVITWGNVINGGDSEKVMKYLVNITEIKKTDYSFAAISANNYIITWGNNEHNSHILIYDIDEIEPYLCKYCKKNNQCSRYSSINSCCFVITKNNKKTLLQNVDILKDKPIYTNLYSRLKIKYNYHEIDDDIEIDEIEYNEIDEIYDNKSLKKLKHYLYNHIQEINDDNDNNDDIIFIHPYYNLIIKKLDNNKIMIIYDDIIQVIDNLINLFIF